VVGFFPKIWVDPVVETLGIRSPGPPQVVSQFTQTGELFWEVKIVGWLSSKMVHTRSLQNKNATGCAILSFVTLPWKVFAEAMI
jgi:hypothetical protein